MSAPNIVDFCNACKAGNLEKVQELVETGVDINGKCDSWPGYTPLMMAIVGGNGVRTKPPVANGNGDVIAFLVYSGADLQMKTAAGRTLFEIVEYNMSDTAFLPVKNFLNDINGNVKILSLFKILYHKYIYLGVETIFDLVETLSLEELDKKGGKKRRTIRKRRSIKKRKSIRRKRRL
jgi:ankyrin repeat protein